MELIHRPINPERDREYILECHCRINYECDCPWKRKMPYESYRAEWLSLTGQIGEFLGYLAETMQDERTIAEILLNESGETVGYLWAPFCEDTESGFRFSEIQDIYIEEEFRRQGVASGLYRYAEENAARHGASVLRAGTGCGNLRSIRLHERMGFVPYRIEFEKLIGQDE